MSDPTLIARLPLADAVEGPIFDRTAPHDANDRLFAAWEAPLVWHHQESYLQVDEKFNRRKAVHFAFERRVPAEVWMKGWHLWYDNALVLRERPPSNCAVEATLALEEQTAGFGSDNVDHARPWCGIVARMQDLRRYYFLALEFPDAVVLYRRDDRQWVRVAYRQTVVDVWTPYRLRLECRGNAFRAWMDDELLFSAVDYAFEDGWAGVRATCTSFVTDLAIHALPTASARPPAAPAAAVLPAAEVVNELDLSEYGRLSVRGRKWPAAMSDDRFNAEILTGDFAGDGRDRLLVAVRGEGAAAATHVCLDLTGRLAWSAVLPGVDHLVRMPAAGRSGLNLVAVGKEELLLLDGRTGEVLRRAPAPRAPNGKSIGAGNCPNATADFDGTGVRQCFFLSCGANDNRVWAYDSDLNLRWFVEAPSGGGHGDHVSVCDVDGDGRDEIFHGCALWDHAGRMRWRQDEAMRRLKCPNGGHVDASVMGFFDGPGAPPTVHMASSSAGHLVADARTGELVAAHPQGHVQTCTSGRVVPGLPGSQVIASNRWGNYGVTAIYAGDGRRLSRFQPGFVCQSTQAIAWTGGGLQHLLVVDGPGWRGIYDHTGRRLVDLDPLVPYDDAHTQRYDRVQAWPLRIEGREGDGVLIRRGSRLRILAAAGR